MARGTPIKHLRKASAFSTGELKEGEIGVNTADKRLEYSPDGTEVLDVLRDAPLTLRYNAANNTWPARPVTARVVFYLALSESIADPTDQQDYDVVFKGVAP